MVAMPKTEAVKTTIARTATMIIVFPFVVVMTPVYMRGLTLAIHKGHIR